MQFLHKINNTNTSNTVIFNKNTPQCTQLKAILCRTSTINSYALHTIKITPNLLFEYQCTSGKFIGLPNQIESKLFLPEFECSSLHDAITEVRDRRANTDGRHRQLDPYAYGKLTYMYPISLQYVYRPYRYVSTRSRRP